MIDKKKAGGAVLAGLMGVSSVMGAAVPALAAIDDSTATHSVSVSNLDEGASATVYQVLTVNWDFDNSQPKEYMYEWASDGIASWVQQNFPQYYQGATNGTPGKTVKAASKAFEKAISDDGTVENDHTATDNGAAEFFDKLAKAIKAGDIADAPTVDSSISDGTVTAEGVSMGSYVTLITGGTETYRPTVTNVLPEFDEGTGEWKVDETYANGTAKKSTVEIAKAVDDKTTAINQEVTYTVTVDVPVYPANAVNKQFKFTDVLPEGVTLTAGSVVVKDADGEELTLADICTDGTAGNSISLDFDYDAIHENETLTIEYKATVDKDVVIGPEGNVNKAKIQFASDPYTAGAYKENEAEVKVFSYGIDVNKVDGTDNPLGGAHFEVQQAGTALSFIKLGDGTYRLAETGETGTTDVVCDDDGNLSVQGLTEGTYNLVETIAPGGYMKLTDPIEVKIADADVDGAVDNNPLAANTGFTTITVTNVEGFSLPRTGGWAGLIALGSGAMALVGWGVSRATRDKGEGQE